MNRKVSSMVLEFVKEKLQFKMQKETYSKAS